MASEGKNLIGVDIGSSAIKLCEVTEKRGKRTLTRFEYAPLPAETIVDGQVINSGAVVETLDRLFHKQRRRNVAIRVSGHSVIIKKIPMPLMTDAELGEQIGWEAEQHIPFDLAEVQLDYQVLGRRDDTGQMEVLLVAAKKDEINDLTNLVTEARLKPLVVDLDAFCIQNVYEAIHGPPPAHETIVLIHTGASITTVNILAEGTTAFTRDITNGGNSITAEVQRAMGITRDEAEAYKCGGDGHGIVPREVPAIVDSVVDQLSGEIQRSLDFYLATSGDRSIDRIYCSGGTANIRSLRDGIAQRAAKNVTLLDSLMAATPDPKKVTAQALEGRVAQASVALGLAIRKEKERR